MLPFRMKVLIFLCGRQTCWVFSRSIIYFPSTSGRSEILNWTRCEYVSEQCVCVYSCIFPNDGCAKLQVRIFFFLNKVLFWI